MQGPLGEIGRYGDTLDDTDRHRHVKELLDNIGGHGDGDY